MKEAYAVAQYLRTRYESKGHGGYDIYEDDKIEIMYDTYYPNLTIYVKDNGEKRLVLSRSGHGYDQERHSGEWENYIKKILYPKAIEAKKKQDALYEEKKAAEHQRMFGQVNDAHIFQSVGGK